MHLHRHVHLGVALHRAEPALLRFAPSFFDEPGAEEGTKDDCDHDDHEWSADEFAGDELPAQQHRHHDPELSDEVRRGDLEGHRCGEVGSLTKERTGERDGGV
jgi:hypothetical protein